MLRRFATVNKTSAAVVTIPKTNNYSSIVPITQRRNAFSTLLLGCPVLGHFATVGSSCTAASILYSPLGTVALIALAFNVNYVGLKHLWYTSEFPMRDYLQDAGLKQVLRYMMLISLLLTGNGLFVEA